MRVVRGGFVAAAVMSAVTVLPVTTAGADSSAPNAPGITKTTITVGQIDDLSQPVPGLFKAAEDGTQAYFNYINSQGGVDGRKIELDTKDSTFNSATVTSEAQAMVNSDFAMVGGFSLLDGAEKDAIDGAKMPDVTVPLALNLSTDPNLYSPIPSATNDYPTGPFLWAKKAFPNQSQHIGILFSNAAASAIVSQQLFDNAANASGLKIEYQRGFGSNESTFNADVLKMKAQGIQMYFDSQLPGFYAANLAQETAQQGFHPVDIQGIAAYIDNMAQTSGGAANGMYLDQQEALYEGEDAKAVPEVSTFDKWVLKVDPKVFSSITPLPSVEGWVSGMLFVQALKAAGANPTRASVEAQLDKVTNFDGNGLLAPGMNPAKNIPSKCFIVAQLKNGTWTRVTPTPKSGFICEGGLHPRPGWKPQTR
jgi:ABC-type branched-subunit amino acid transport system substrate-binding protein